MGTLVFQANLGGAVNLIGPNTASTVNFTLPSADGTSGQALVTNGSGTLSFSTFTSGAAGSNTQVQFNSSGAFAGSANLTFNGTTLTSNALTVTNATTLSAGTANGVAYLNGSKVVTTGSALTFDGTNLAATGSISTTISSKTAQFNAAGGSIYAQFADGTTTWRLGTGIQAAGQFNLYDVTNAQTALTFVPGASGYTAFLQNNSEQMRLTSTGLGIGTSSPGAKLDVNGGALIQGLTVGRGAGSVSSNTAVGASALAANTTGTENVAVGNRAAEATTTASDVTAVGFRAARANTTGTPTAFGAYALDGNTTGTNNTALGSQALASNTTASNNTAVGYQAGYSNTTGYNNALFGQNTGASITTGYANTFIGRAAGEDVTTGTRNTILGRYSGNQGGLDIRTSSNNIVLSDGDGNPRTYWTTTGVNYTGFVGSGAIETYISSTCGRVNYYNDAGATQGCQYFYYSSVEKGSISISSTATAYNTSSDYRLKNSIAPMTGALAKVAQLKPVTYKWNADGSDGQGFIAHELAEVVPQCVTGEKDAVDADGNPQYQGIDTSFLVATLTAAIQELKAEFDAYKASHP